MVTANFTTFALPRHIQATTTTTSEESQQSLTVTSLGQAVHPQQSLGPYLAKEYSMDSNSASCDSAVEDDGKGKGDIFFPLISREELVSRANASERGNVICLGDTGAIRVGEFVNYHSTKIGQVISINDRRDIDEDELECCGHEKEEGTDRDRFVLLRKMVVSNAVRNPGKHNNVPDSLVEVVETRLVEWVEVASVSGIAFVFHFDDIHSGKYLCGGMSNAYGIRSRQPEGNVESVSPIHPKQWNPWWSPYGDNYESYSRRIYNMLAALMDSAFRSLSFKGNFAGRNKHLHFKGCSKEIMNYLTDGLEEGVIRKQYKQYAAKKRQLPNMAVCNRRMKTTTDMVRLVTHDALSDFRLRIGSVFGAAVNKAVPTMKEQKDKNCGDTVYCNDGDQVRLLDCDVDDLFPDEDKYNVPLPDEIFSGGVDPNQIEERYPLLFKRPCPYAGLDIEFTSSEYGLTDLHLNIKFKNVRAESEAVDRLRFGGCKQNPKPKELTIVEGALLQVDDNIFRVKHVDLEKERVKLTDYVSESEETVCSMELQEATELTRKYNCK